MARPALRLIVDEPAAETIAAGDVVRTGDHPYPRYRVIATSDDRAWVQDAQDGTDYIVPISRCRKL